MQIGVATLVAGSETPVGDGVSGAQRCVLQLADGSMCSAVLKAGPPGQILAECFCALLLRAWGLSVPDPYVVNVGSGIAFAGADAGYPSLKQRLSLDSLPEGPARDAAIALACRLASGFDSTPLALAIDEAIDNRDRNLGNILWDGQIATWIDHALSLGEGTGMDDCNKLAAMAIASGEHERIMGAAVTHALALRRESIQEAHDGVAQHFDASNAAAFVSSRASSLANAVLARFPQPRDLFSAAP